jgi:putative methyltransferase
MQTLGFCYLAISVCDLIACLHYEQVKGILLDPSCSGSGTSVQRLDHLLPSAAEGRSEDELEKQRVEQLARFQQTALLHALSFPAVERVVYSTCSIHQRENEDVVRFVLPQANAQGFQLASPFPSWPHRGLPVFDGGKYSLLFLSLCIVLPLMQCV